MMYKLRHTVTGEIVIWSLDEILENINRDRSELWEDYNEEDWQEGLEHFTEWELIDGR